MLTNIAKIDTASARKLSSGQVVVDLAGAVKELLENALDAGATSIELRINDDGGGAEIECADNGHGMRTAWNPSASGADAAKSKSVFGLWFHPRR